MEAAFQHLQQLIDSGAPENIELAFSIMESTGNWLPLPTEDDLLWLSQMADDSIDPMACETYLDWCKEIFRILPHWLYFSIEWRPNERIPEAFRWLKYVRFLTLEIPPKVETVGSFAALPDWFFTTFQGVISFTLKGDWAITTSDWQRLEGLKMQRLSLKNNPQLTAFPIVDRPIRGIQELTLSHCNVRHCRLDLLPDLLEFTLNERANTLDCTELSLQQPISLRRMYLTRVLLTNAVLEKLPQLDYLGCWNVETTEPLHFPTNQSIKHCIIHYPNDLNHWAELGKATHLEHLACMNAYLEEVPDWVLSITSLKELNLIGNKLRTIPESIRHCSHLERLDLSDNHHLESLPEGLLQLKKLERLTMNRVPLDLPGIQAVIERLAPTVHIQKDDDLPF